MKTDNPRRRRRGRAIDPKAQQAIEELALRGYTPAQIGKLLRDDVEYAWIEPAPLPHTIRRIVRDVTPPDASDPWSPSPATDPAEARAVLTVLAAVIEKTEGRVSTVTEREADWIAFIAVASPLVMARAPWLTFRLARAYILRHEREEPTADLDAYLAFFTTPRRVGRYEDAVKAGWVKPPGFAIGRDKKLLTEDLRDIAEDWRSRGQTLFADLLQYAAEHAPPGTATLTEIVEKTAPGWMDAQVEDRLAEQLADEWIAMKPFEGKESELISPERLREIVVEVMKKTGAVKKVRQYGKGDDDDATTD